ncbi:unnamed protein product [Mytilus edulis]|uniref:Uncharacterized protein n=1 Tax=Mytilus edulis TaxID=6550 RepID=A0A8S3SA25_MYTED|nr:unnamed protein product [Mytilus edulis]
MQGLDLLEFDPLNSKSAGSYVQSVMATSVVNQLITTADISVDVLNEKTVSNNNRLKRPHESDSDSDSDLYSENAKKLKPETVHNNRVNLIDGSPHSQCTQNKHCSDKLDDICELKNLVVGLANSMNKFCDILTKRMGDIETNIPKQVANMIDQKVSEEMKKVREEFKTELKTVSEKVVSLEQSYSDVVKQNKKQSQVISEDNLSLVIKNLPETEKENIACKVDDLIKVGLHLNSIQVAAVDRKKNNHTGKPGIVIVKLQNKEDKQKVMEKKRELRNTRIYKDVYINNAIPNAQRLLNSNLRSIVNAIGNDKLEIRGSVVRARHDKSTRDTNTNTQRRGDRDDTIVNNVSGNRGYYRRNDRGRGNTRGGNSHNTDQRSTYRNGQSTNDNHNQSERNLNGRGRGNYRGQNGGHNQNSRDGHK